MARPRAMYTLGEESEFRPKAINQLVYAHPGAGKTVFWGTGDGVVIMDSDHGVESAEAFGSSAKVVPVTDYQELHEAYDFAAHDAEKEGIRWIVWDSLTLFQDRALIDEILPDAHAENPRQSEDVASQREYLVNMNRIGRYVRMFVELPINFGISCHVAVEEDPAGNLIYVPAVQGKNMSSKVSGYMNVVTYYGATAKGTRRMITERTAEYFSKDRFNALRTNGKGFVDNPTLPKIEGLIEARRATLSSGNVTPIRRRRRRPAN